MQRRLKKEYRFGEDMREFEIANAAEELGLKVERILETGGAEDAENTAALEEFWKPLKKFVQFYLGDDSGLYYEGVPEPPAPEPKQRKVFGIPFAKKVHR